MSIKITSMNFGDCDTILHNTPNGMKNIAEVLGPNGEVYWSAAKEITGIPPLSIRSNGTMLLDYLISGNMSQSGTPTPDSPIMPQETGERTKNLSNVSDYTNNNTDTRTYLSFRILMSKNGSQTETFSSSMQGIGEKSFSFTLTTEADTMRIVHNGSQQNLFIEELTGEFSGTYTFSFDLESNDPTTIGGLKLSDIMLNTGSTALPYEPYGYKLTISSANTTTPIYLGEVETTRRIKKLEFDGTENWTYESQYSRFILIRTDAYYSGTVRTTPCNCSHYQPIYDRRTIDDVPNESIYITTSSGRTAFNVKSTDFTSVTDFKSYLAAQYAAGTPVTVWYVLAEPETAVVNEPLRKIGDYADTLSMEQAGVQIPTNRGNTIIDVETTLKPSQMYIKYK